MNETPSIRENKSEWFAIKTRQDFKAEKVLAPICDEVLFPKDMVCTEGKRNRVRAIIPRVLFIKTSKDKALQLEQIAREHPEQLVPFWIYRYPKDNEIQVISHKSIELLRLLTAADTTRCEIFSRTDFKANQLVKVIDGRFKGYEGYVVRVRKNKHVVVKIEGVCMVMLPFIHPDLLELVDRQED